MPYYIRLFSKSSHAVSADQLRTSLPSELDLKVESGSETSWKELIVTSKDGREMCMIERNVRGCDDVAVHEIEEFVDVQENAEPQSAAQWVKSYLKSCQSIYTCRFLNAALGDDFGDVPSVVMWCIKSEVGGILQADGEGFSNEDGYHATWDFSDDVTGTWKMAVLVRADKWQHFEMDLGDASHRIAFRAGRVPVGVAIE